MAAFAQKPDSFLKSMSYVPAKTFQGSSYIGTASQATYASRNMSVEGFYISTTEVTNAEYLQFTSYVRDSIAHSLLKHFKKGTIVIDWSKKINWNDSRLKDFFLSPEENRIGKPQIDPSQLNYEIDFFGEKEVIQIYPDTLVWMNDFSYSYNEPLVKKYFSHPAYQNFPVVGVTLKQAIAFCQWKTSQLKKGTGGKEMIVRLPTAQEWEGAAMEQKDTVKLVSNKGYNYNFGTITDRGFTVKDYADDGFFYTSPVKKFLPGPYGLYDMKGNVAEWTSTQQQAKKENNGETDRYVVKGGGWDSSPFYLQAGASQQFPANGAHSFIGFRYVAEITAKK